MINKLALHYKVDAGGLDKLTAALTEVAPQIHNRLAGQDGAVVRVMTLVEGAAAQTPHVTRQGYRPTALRAVVEFGHEEARLANLIEVARAMLARVAGMADAASSCALAGREYVFSPGDNTHMLRVYMGRAFETPYEDFHSHWRDRHGWLVKPRVDARGGAYRQFHADPKASALAARAAGLGRHDFEGAAISFQPDAETYVRAMSRAADDIFEDEKRFMSAADTEVGFYRIVLELK